jgi:peptidoglycan hydrolase CwlO-like protein
MHQTGVAAITAIKELAAMAPALAILYPIIKTHINTEQNTADVKEVKGEVKKLTGEVRELTGEVKEMKGEVKEQKGEVKELRGDIKQLTVMVTALCVKQGISFT